MGGKWRLRLHSQGMQYVVNNQILGVNVVGAGVVEGAEAGAGKWWIAIETEIGAE